MKGCDTPERERLRSATLDLSSLPATVMNLLEVRRAAVDAIAAAGLADAIPLLKISIDESGAYLQREPFAFDDEDAETWTDGVDLDIDAADPSAQIDPASLAEFADVAVAFARPVAAVAQRDACLSAMATGTGGRTRNWPAWCWAAHPLAIAVLDHLGMDPDKTCEVRTMDGNGHPTEFASAFHKASGTQIQAFGSGVLIEHSFRFDLVPDGRKRNPFHPIQRIHCHGYGAGIVLAENLPETMLSAAIGKPIGEIIEAEFLKPGTPVGDLVVAHVNHKNGSQTLRLERTPFVPFAPGTVNRPWLAPEVLAALVPPQAETDQ